MALRPSIDIATRVSSELSSVIERIANDPDREATPTLRDVFSELKKNGAHASHKGDSLHPQDRSSIVVELNELIDEFGSEARALDFVTSAASESLSRAIEAAMDDPSLPDEPTLGAVRAAILNGLGARLIGNGVLDADEDATLLEEIDELIRRFGEDAPAESFMRFE